jgi:phage FluMu protein Com
MINVRCQHCRKLLCKVSKDYYGVVAVICHRCGKPNTVSVAVILKQMSESSATITPPTQVSTRT